MSRSLGKPGGRLDGHTPKVTFKKLCARISATMMGLGTIINSGAIVAGGLVGLAAGRFIGERIQKIIKVAIGLSVTAMSISGIVGKMLVNVDGVFESHGTYVNIFSLVLGGLLGEAADIDGKLESFGCWLKKKSGSENDAGFVDGFVTGSLTVCIGAMAVVGAIMDGIKGDYSILLTKSIMDFVIIIAMTATSGKGVIFSAIPVFVFQGGITLLARLLAPVLTDVAINNISLVGSLLILCIGINIIADGKFRIKVANLLPSLIFAVAAAFIPLKLFSM